MIERKAESSVLGGAERYMRQFLDKRHADGLPISGSHSETHLLAVAADAVTVCNLYELSTRTSTLAGLAGMFHDIVREPTEIKGSGGVGEDEKLSASIANQFMTDIGIFTDAEKAAVADAITNQSVKPPVFLQDNREVTPETLGDQVHLALFVADKLQANGTAVIARRSHFVAGERLQSEQGDLHLMGFDSADPQDRLKVVAIESLLRLAFINPQQEYPNRLTSLVDAKYAVQREFVRGVFKAGGFTVEQIVKELVKPREVYDGKNMLENKKIKIEDRNLSTLTQVVERLSGITQHDINNDATTPDELAAASQEVVGYFSDHWEEDVAIVEQEFQPNTEYALQWFPFNE